MTRWTALKGQVSDAIGVGHDILHLPLGVLIFFGFAYLLRHHRHRLWLALGAVTALQLINEVFDGVQWILWTGEIAWGEAARDTAMTVAVPLALVAGAALTRTVLRGRARARSSDASEPASAPEPVSSRV